MPAEADVVIPAPGETFVGEDGTVSVVLEDNADGNYEPTQEEIEEFAAWMGMQLPEDKEFLHIARDGLKAPLPKDWRPCRTNEDEIYYFNFRTGESTWNHPMDEFFRESFIKEKERKKTGGGAHNRERGGVGGTTTTTAGGGGGGGGVSSNSGGSGLIMKMPPPGTMRDATATSPVALGSALGSTKLTTNNGLTLKGLPPRVVPAADAAKQTTPSGGGGGGERRIMSEAEKNLEEKIREEREAEFKAEEEKAEVMQQERLQEMRKMHETELTRLREDLEARWAAVRGEAAAAEEAELRRRRRELEDTWKASLDRERVEEEKLKQQLASLKEEHTQRVASEVAKAEATLKQQLEQQRKQMETSAAASLEKVRAEARAEFTARKDALRNKSQEEMRQLKEAAERRQKTEMASMQKKHEESMKRQDNSSAVATTTTPAAASTGASTAESDSARVAAIRAQEKEEVAAILCRSREEQETLRTAMEGKLKQMRRELCELEGPAPVSLGNARSAAAGAAGDALEELRRRWRAEEMARIRVLEDDRRKKLAAVQRPPQASSTPSTPLSPASTNTATTTNTTTTNTTATTAPTEEGAGLRAAFSAVLAQKAKTLQETEELLRATLQEEFTRTTAPMEARVTGAVEGAVKVFIRSTEAQRRLEQEDFERRRDKALAAHKVAKEAYDKKVAEQKAKLLGEAKAEMEEMLREAQQKAVGTALQAMEAEQRSAEEKIRRRYDDERRAFVAEIDEEMLAYAQKERQDVEAQEEARAKKQEEKMRLAAKEEALVKAQKAAEKRKEEAAAAAAEAAAKRQPPQTPGIPLELLQRRLSAIEKTYEEQELKMQAELESIKAEIARLGEALVVQEQKPPQEQEQPQLQQQQQRQYQLQLLQQYHQQQLQQMRGGPIAEMISSTALQSGTEEVRHPTPFSSEALRFLNEQQREFSTRRGALNAAREDWHNEVRNASLAPSLNNGGGGLLCDTADAGPVNSQLLSLVGTLGDRLEHLTGHISKLQAAKASVSPERHHHNRQHRHHHEEQKQHRRHRSPAGRYHTHERDASGTKRKSPRLSPSKQRPHTELVQKWSQILLDLAAPPQRHGELSASIQRFVTD
ncbi:putative glutamic acid-rich protein precursor [Trypanosoma grayi]|uniref:putative glutamic acid-rich protein precursor n=1 Tax=Trypanosoma grayi TaxID=71804 RepID=UPI0004F47C04|nr:putative glutamic acid-rich protein precursor [Trypanosoma grayi]KEG11184.1 putative glutamic acid-rich protein precursor [Trypanosoma grayi]